MNAELISNIARKFGELDAVEAVVLSGSCTANCWDARSDLDFYVYIHQPIPVSVRKKIAGEFARKSEIDNHFWENGDEWIEKSSGLKIDIMYRPLSWIEGELNRVLEDNQASVGYSTCLWHNFQSSKPLYSANGWFKSMKQKADKPYPAKLREAIISKNYPILRNNISSYANQIQLAFQRHDLVSLNHRISALIASYFDIIFALNQVPHPGEKRLIETAKARCQKLPADMEFHINNLIVSMTSPDWEPISSALTQMIDGLDRLLKRERMVA